MHVRRFLAGVVTVAVAMSGVLLTAGSAAATTDPQPDDTAGTPTLTMLIGVGSDTTQRAVKLVGDAYNATSPTNPIHTYAACASPSTCGMITLPSGDIPRPNGSGAGKQKLYGAGDNLEIDFARSSSAQNTAETNAGLQSFPFALDQLQMVVSNTVASNAPASLTTAQIVSIYKGDITNWNQVGGTSGVIAPKIPQAGSGTRSFFDAQLASLNGGSAVVLGASVVAVQEHDDTEIKNNPNAVAPFSVGRAGLLGATLRFLGGYKADRAVYNVVRGSDVGKAEVLAASGRTATSAPLRPSR